MGDRYAGAHRREKVDLFYRIDYHLIRTVTGQRAVFPGE